jgi:hypothetical protein
MATKPDTKTTDSKGTEAKLVNGRGFREFGGIKTSRGSCRVTESSLMGEGAHVWIFSKPEGTAPHLNVEAAKELIALLQMFVAEAEAGKLWEPAVCEEESETD